MNTPYAEVIGDPIAHSQSPLIHNFWLKKLGIDAEYRAVHVKSGMLRDYLNSRRNDPDWRGCNATMPHKKAIIDNVDAVSDAAKAIGAANTVISVSQKPSQKLLADNTDLHGFLEPLCDTDLADGAAIVIGAGGAARAVVSALKEKGVSEITIANRSIDRACSLIESLRLYSAEATSLDVPLPRARLVVNATSLGMVGMPPLDLDLSGQGEDTVVYDIVYTPLETHLLKRAKEQGLRTIDGLAMLIGQASLAFTHFFGEEPPRHYDSELRKLLTQ